MTGRGKERVTEFEGERIAGGGAGGGGEGLSPWRTGFPYLR